MKKLYITIYVLFFNLNTYALSVPSALVDARWLEQNINQVKILDVRKQLHNFNDIGHIKGAILLNNKKVRVTRTMHGKTITRLIPSRKDFDKFISKHSINSNDTIIISHEGNTAGNFVAAARLYWQFKVYGYKNIAILDGGNKAYSKYTLEELNKENRNIQMGKFKTTFSNKNILSNINNVKNAIKNNSHTIIDTRSLRFYIGLEKRSYVQSYGHIPNTKHFPFKFLSESKSNNKLFKKEKLISLFKSMNINPFKPIILYCNSGFEASSVWFALYEIIENKNVSIYDASLHEWTKDISNPMSKNLSEKTHTH